MEPPMATTREVSYLPSWASAGASAADIAAPIAAARTRNLIAMELLSSGRGRTREARQVLGDHAAVIALHLPFVPFAEELDDQLIVRAIGFERRDMPVLGGLANRPYLADVIEPQMQVERLVEDIDPRSHRLDRRHGTGVDLDAAVVAHEA